MTLELTPTHLRVCTTPFDFAAPQCDPEELARDLIEVMTRHRGLGIAANQCGLEHRVAAVYGEHDPTRGYGGFVLFNPMIVDKSEKTELMDEYCLSFPGLIMQVRRPAAIRVRFADARGEVSTHVFRGMTARVVQHEIAHLDGVLFFDGASRPKLDAAIRRAEKRFGKHYTMRDLT